MNEVIFKLYYKVLSLFVIIVIIAFYLFALYVLKELALER